MAQPYLLALDEGTTSARALIFSLDGAILGLGRSSLETTYPQSGWVEQQPEAIWNAQLQAIEQALANARLQLDAITTLGLTNQRETTLVWDRQTGQAVYPAIVWQDRRTAAYCQKMRDSGHQQRVQEKTGLVLDPYFSATKIRWILDQVENGQERAQAGELAFGTVDTWLIWKLTGGRVHATDPSNACRTMLYNLYTGAWDPELLELFGVPEKLLPKILPSNAHFGQAYTLGPQAPPITGVLGDQQAALFGQGCRESGQAKNTYGTGCFLLMQTGATPVASPGGLLTTVAWETTQGRQYALEGAIFSAGTSLSWLEQLGLYSGLDDLTAKTASVSDAGGAWLAPAFAGLGAPHWDPTARGAILGLTAGVRAGHLLRAGLEAMAYQSDEVLQLMAQESGTDIRELRVDGGIANNDWLMQFQADLSNLELIRPAQTESTAWGAAHMAAFGAGLLNNWGEHQPSSTPTTFQPNAQFPRQEQRSRWLEVIERAKGWAANGA